MELTLFVDHQCNLRCSYCYTGKKFRRPMSREVMRRAVELALGRAGPELDIAFFGGEPLVRFGLLQETTEHVETLLGRLPPPRPTVRWLLNTNATLVTDRVLDWMVPRKMSAAVSLDGTRDVHDACRVDARGRGSHERVLAGIRRLRERGVPLQLVAVVGTASAERVGQMLEELLPLGAYQIVFSINYRDDWDEAAIGRLRQGLAAAGRIWMREFRAGRARIVEPLHTKILTHLRGGVPCPSRCLLGGREFTVTPKGRIYPCAQMVEEDRGEGLVIGNVDTGLDTQRMLELGRQKDRVEETCKACALRDRCQSHCGCRHLALTGELGRVSSVLCETEAALIEAADEVAGVLYRESCPAFLDQYYRKTWKAAIWSALTPLRRAREG
jgi:uncharacterized protein